MNASARAIGKRERTISGEVERERLRLHDEPGPRAIGPLPTPICFGPFLLVERLGDGPSSEVFLAKAEVERGRGERFVAVKRILVDEESAPAVVDAYVARSKNLSRLAHPNVVPVLEVGEVDGTYYIARDLVRGRSLRDVLGRLARLRQRFPIPVATYVAHAALQALTAIHEEGGDLHGDVSPSQVLLAYDGRVRLTDVGVHARDLVHQDRVLDLDRVRYSSPERVRGQLLTGASDLFSLGICLYEMLTGVRLFAGQGEIETLRAIENAWVEPPSRLRPEISPGLDALVLKALARDPAMRWQSAEIMMNAVAALPTGERPARTASSLETLMHDAFRVERAEEDARIVVHAAARWEDADQAYAPNGDAIRHPSRHSLSTMLADRDGPHFREPDIHVFFHAEGGLEPEFPLGPRATAVAWPGSVLGQVRGSMLNRVMVLDTSGPGSRAKEPSAEESVEARPSFLPSLQKQRALAGAGVLVTMACVFGLYAMVASSPDDVPEAVAEDGTLSPQSGGAEITTQPEQATIFIDGERRGTSPLVLEELSVGRHVLRIEADGFDSLERSIDVKAGSSVLVHYALPERSGSGSSSEADALLAEGNARSDEAESSTESEKTESGTTESGKTESGKTERGDDRRRASELDGDKDDAKRSRTRRDRLARDERRRRSGRALDVDSVPTSVTAATIAGAAETALAAATANALPTNGSRPSSPGRVESARGLGGPAAAPSAPLTGGVLPANPY